GGEVERQVLDGRAEIEGRVEGAAAEVVAVEAGEGRCAEGCGRGVGEGTAAGVGAGVGGGDRAERGEGAARRDVELVAGDGRAVVGGVGVEEEAAGGDRVGVRVGERRAGAAEVEDDAVGFGGGAVDGQRIDKRVGGVEDQDPRKTAGDVVHLLVRPTAHHT